jgi:hypothetical protein
LENIRARAHFLVLLTPTALERCSDPEDWVRREIEAAIDDRRNIVPLMLPGFSFDTPNTASQLTGKLAALKKYNGLDIPRAYFQQAMERLRDKFLNVPVDALLLPASDSAQQVAKEQKDKATEADQSDVEEILFQLGGDFDADYDGDLDADYDSERSNRWMGRRLPELLGKALPKAKELKVRGWRYAFDAPTTTGIWIGYAQISEEHADGMLQLYRNCLVLRVDEQRKIIGAAMTCSVSIAHKELGLSSWTVGENVLAHAGTVELGVAIPLKARHAPG